MSTITADGSAFGRLLEPYRSELLAHCYRMLGSVHEAEDVVQETYLRAWRARERYDASRASLRTWLYRIATNACLTARENGSRRPLPSGFTGPSEPLDPFVPGRETAWLQPLPDTLFPAGDPAHSALERGTLRLAFVAALQHLSARQRAVLILRDVLGFSAAETAEIIGASVISVNSALRRARSSMAAGAAQPDELSEPPEAERQALVERYMRAFETADVAGIKRLLTDDVLMEMPPMLNWFVGRENYGLFMEWVFKANGTDWRLEPLGANGQPAFAAYVRRGPSYRLHTVQVFTISANGISRLTVFQDDTVFASFGLPLETGRA